MTNKRLKLLIAVIILLIAFVFWYNQWHSEDFITEMQGLSLIGSGMINIWDTGQVDEQAIWEDTKKRLAEQVDKLVGNYDISYTIVHECTSKVENYKKCIQDVVGVANAESTIFKKGMYPSNNGFWLMQKTKDGYKKMRFSSVEESIEYRVNLYVKKNRWKRATWQDWLNWKYCTSACEWRIRNYSSAIIKLGELE